MPIFSYSKMVTDLEKIIDFVKENAILYDSRHRMYRNLSAKDKKWKELGKVTNRNIDILKGQWRNLKDSYCRYLKSTKSNASPAERRYRHWHWAEHMAFLKPYLRTYTMRNRRFITKNGTSRRRNLRTTQTSSNDNALLVERKTDITKQETMELILPDISFADVSSLASMSPHAIDVLDTTITHIIDETKRQYTSEEETSTNSHKMTRNVNTTNTDDENVVSCSQSRADHDAVDYLFLSWAKTVKLFSPRRLLETKMKLSNIILQQEGEQLKEDMMSPKPEYLL